LKALKDEMERIKTQNTEVISKIKELQQVITTLTIERDAARNELSKN